MTEADRVNLLLSMAVELLLTQPGDAAETFAMHALDETQEWRERVEGLLRSGGHAAAAEPVGSVPGMRQDQDGK
jgi:hypothetical protein